MKILVINPGSTSTKIAVYENETPLLVRNISHTVEELSVYSQVVDQFEFRKNLVLQELEANKIPFDFDAVIGRGGLVKPIPGGVYEVNEAMKRDTVHAMRTHACNLGGLIADKLASSLPNCRAFIADPGVVDELEDIARITGSPLMPKITIWHALNQKAIARRFAREQGTQYEDLDLIICHWEVVFLLQFTAMDELLMQTMRWTAKALSRRNVQVHCLPVNSSTFVLADSSPKMN